MPVDEGKGLRQIGRHKSATQNQKSADKGRIRLDMFGDAIKHGNKSQHDRNTEIKRGSPQDMMRANLTGFNLRETKASPDAQKRKLFQEIIGPDPDFKTCRGCATRQSNPLAQRFGNEVFKANKGGNETQIEHGPQKQMSLWFPNQPIELPENDDRAWKRSRTSSSSNSNSNSSSSSGGGLKRSKTTGGSGGLSHQLSKSKSFSASRSSSPHGMPLLKPQLQLQSASKSSEKAAGKGGQQPPHPEGAAAAGRSSKNSSSKKDKDPPTKIQPKYQEVVRKKAEREALRGFQCNECKSYYEG